MKRGTNSSAKVRTISERGGYLIFLVCCFINSVGWIPDIFAEGSSTGGDKDPPKDIKSADFTAWQIQQLDRVLKDKYAADLSDSGKTKPIIGQAMLDLAKISPHTAVKSIKPYLNHKDVSLQETAIFALSLTETLEAHDIIVDLIKGKDKLMPKEYPKTENDLTQIKPILGPLLQGIRSLASMMLPEAKKARDDFMQGFRFKYDHPLWKEIIKGLDQEIKDAEELAKELRQTEK